MEFPMDFSRLWWSAYWWPGQDKLISERKESGETKDEGMTGLDGLINEG
jgi:hypothetical protein